MRAPVLLSLSLLIGLVTGPALAWNEALDTPEGVARVEGDRAAMEPLTLFVGGRALWRTEDWLRIWPEQVVGRWLLVGLTQGGTACPTEWMWLNLDSGAASEVFGTCGGIDEVREEPDGSLSVATYSYDADWPIWRYGFDGTTVTEVREPQRPAEIPPGAPAEQWIGRAPFEIFRASDWRGPLVELWGEEVYDEAQSAFGQVGYFEVEGDWIVAWGCMSHACGMLEGRIALHREDGRIVLVLAEIDEMPRIYGEPGGALPPLLAELAEQF
jgi:hypothetical protein